MTGLVLYNYDLDENCYKVRIALSMLGLPYQTVAVNAFPGKEHKTQPFLAMNPLGSLPIVKDGDITLFGAEAILSHLAASHDPARTWLPTGGADFAHVMQWLMFSAGDTRGYRIRPRACAVRRARRRGGIAGRRARGPAHHGRPPDGARLRGRRLVCGRGPTVADIALFPAFALSRDFGIDHDEYPALRRWARRFRALPGFLTMPGIPDYH